MSDQNEPPWCRACGNREFTEHADSWECDDCGIREYDTNEDLLP